MAPSRREVGHRARRHAEGAVLVAVTEAQDEPLGQQPTDRGRHGTGPVGGDDRRDPDRRAVGHQPGEHVEPAVGIVAELGAEAGEPVDHEQHVGALGPSPPVEAAPVELGGDEAQRPPLALPVAGEHHRADVR